MLFRSDEVVKLVGMDHHIRETVKKYSLGMKQRIGLAQAILHKPKLLILDEPTNGLDPSGIRELRDILKNLAHQENVAVLVSSHLLTEMEQMCDRVGIIDKGKLLGVKLIKELLDEASGKPLYRFSTKEAEKSAGLLSLHYGDFIKEVNDEYLELQIDEEAVAEVNRLLVTNNIAIYGIAKVEASLEDAFFNVTGRGNSIA